MSTKPAGGTRTVSPARASPFQFGCVCKFWLHNTDIHILFIVVYMQCLQYVYYALLSIQISRVYVKRISTEPGLHSGSATETCIVIRQWLNVCYVRIVSKQWLSDHKACTLFSNYDYMSLDLHCVQSMTKCPLGLYCFQNMTTCVLHGSELCSDHH